MNNLDKETLEWIDEIYKNYCKSFKNQSIIEQYSFDTNPMTQQMFVEKIKTNSEFANKFGIKVETRELSDGERLWLCSQRHHIRFGTNYGPSWYNPDNPDRDKLKWMTEDQRQLCNYKNIPTKAISLTYNDKTIEIYEQPR